METERSHFPYRAIDRTKANLSVRHDDYVMFSFAGKHPLGLLPQSTTDGCGGINPYTLTARLGLGGLTHYETSSRLDPTAWSFAQGNKTWRSSRILVG